MSPEGHTDGWAWITSSRDHTDGCDGRVGPMCDGGIVGFSPTSEIDGGGAQHIGGGSTHPSG
jgi:hypothetical protein